MAITKNPWEVGYSSPKEMRTALCQCCQFRFDYIGAESEPAPPKWCPNCRKHYPTAGETETRELERLREHEPRIYDYMHKARHATADLEAKDKDKSRQVAAALEDRNYYRAICHELDALHVQRSGSNKCMCGGPWPCETSEVIHPPRRTDTRNASSERRPLTADYGYLLGLPGYDDDDQDD